MGPILRLTKLAFLRARATLKENTITAPKTCFNNFFSDVRDQEGGAFSKREIKCKVLNPESVIVLTKNFKSCHKFLSRFYGMRRYFLGGISVELKDLQRPDFSAENGKARF